MRLNMEKHKYTAQHGGQIIGYYTNPACAANSVRDAHNIARGAVPGFCGVALGADIVLTLSDCLSGRPLVNEEVGRIERAWIGADRHIARATELMSALGDCLKAGRRQ